MSSSTLFASLFGKESLVGLDIGSAYLKAVQVEPATPPRTPGADPAAPAARAFRVVRATQAPTPPEAVRDGVVVDVPAVAQAVHRMLSEANISATGAITAVAGSTVVVRTIRMPLMSEAALRKSVRYEAGKYISANVNESAIEFEILGPGGAGAVAEPGAAQSGEDGASAGDQMNVMLVAAPREMVESRLAVVENAGLEAVAVDIEAFALRRALIECAGAQAVEPASNETDEAALAAAAAGSGGPGLRALIDLGASHTEVTLLLGDDFALTRSIPIAGEAFTNVFLGHFLCTFDEAEEHKANVDMAVLLDPERAGDTDACALPRLLQPMLDELLREVRRSIHYYQSQLEGEGAARSGAGNASLLQIVLSGGGAQLGGIAPYMSARLGTQVRIGNAFASPLFDARPESAAFVQAQYSRLGVCAGLAVKEMLLPAATAAGPFRKAA